MRQSSMWRQRGCRWACLAATAISLVWGASACRPAPTPPPTEGVAPIAGPTVLAPTAAVAAPTGAVPVPTGAVQNTAALEQAMRDAGLNFVSEGDQQLEYFVPPARIYAQGNDTLEVHTYPDADAAAVAASLVSPDGQIIRRANGEPMAVAWLGSPHFYQSGPLLVVYVGTDPAILAALETALGPQFAGASGGQGVAAP
jgi:hypothetical protein